MIAKARLVFLTDVELGFSPFSSYSIDGYRIYIYSRIYSVSQFCHFVFPNFEIFSLLRIKRIILYSCLIFKL